MPTPSSISDPAQSTLREADRHEIYDLKSRYFFCADNKDWVGLRSVFAEDARFEGFAFEGSGPDGFVDGARKYLEGVVTVHHGCMPQLHRLSDTVVKGRWSMVDYCTWKAGSRGYRGHSSPTLSGFRGHGYYEEEYVRGPAGWKIKFLRLTRLRIDLISDSELPDRLGTLPPTLDWLS